MITKDTSESAKNIYELLSENRLGVLGTNGHEAAPHQSAVYYQVNEHFEISFVTRGDTQKCKNIEQNPNVSMLVANEENQLTVRITGVAEAVSDQDTVKELMKHVHESAYEADNDQAPLDKLMAGDPVAFRIKPSKISMALFIRPGKGGYEMYEELDFDDGAED